MSAGMFLGRDSGFADYARRYKVMINGEEKGQIKNGGTFECEIPAGQHTLQLKVDWCSSNTLEFEVRENETVRLECGSNLRGWKLLKAGKTMRETPHAWIWLRRASNNAMQATCEDARA